MNEALEIAEEIGFPLVIRPSYVLGGRAMEIVRDMSQLNATSRKRLWSPGDSPVLLDSYLAGAVELDVDALCDGKDVHVAGIMQHIEEAACPFRRQRLFPAALFAVERHHRRDQAPDRGTGHRAERRWPDERAIRHQGRRDLPDRSEPARLRTVPFVAKATDSAIASIAAPASWRVRSCRTSRCAPPTRTDVL